MKEVAIILVVAVASIIISILISLIYSDTAYLQDMKNTYCKVYKGNDIALIKSCFVSDTAFYSYLLKSYDKKYGAKNERNY